VSRPKKNYDMDEQRFKALLLSLDRDPQTAAAKYTHLHRALTQWFYYNDRQCLHPQESLADVTIDRLATKLVEGATFTDIHRFARGIARFVLQEARTRPAKEVTLGDGHLPEPPSIGPEATDPNEAELERLLDRLEPEDRTLIIQFHGYDKGEKIHHRRRLAERLGISMNALRGRVHRIKRNLLEEIELKLGVK
jgi:DNA-directed RNA polymerase specialized sigma24 family protein